MNNRTASVTTTDLTSYQLLVESVKEYAIFMLDPTGHIVTWNKGAERIKGYAASEIIGQHFSRFYPPEDILSSKPDRVLQIAVKEGKYEEEGWRIRKDGSRFWASVVITPLFDQEGLLDGFAKVTRDLTERKQAEEALRSSETELRAIMDNAADGIITANEKGIIQSVNRAGAEIFGYMPAELIGQNVSLLMPEPYRSAHDGYIERYQQTGEARLIGKGQREVVGKHKEGHEIPLELALSETQVNGQRKIIAAIRDFTQRKQFEDALKEANETLEARVQERTAQWQALFAHSPTPAAQVALAGDWLVVNHAFCALSGYSAEELMAMTYREISPPEELTKGEAYLQRLLSGEIGSYQRERKFTRKDGTDLLVEASVSLVRDADGNPKYYIVVCNDITWRKQAEEALQASEKQFRAIFEHAAEGIAQLDLSGNYLRVNAAMCRMHAYSEKEFRSLSLRDITSPEDREMAVARFQELVSGAVGAIRFEKRNIRKNRTRVWVDANISLVNDPAGRPLYGIAMVEDITRRKQAEEAMRRAEAHFRLLVEGTDDYAIMRLDHYGNIASWNPGAEKILGYRENEIIGQHFSVFYTAEDKERGEPQRKLSRAIREGRAEDDRWSTRKNGSRFWGTGVINALYDEGGNVLGFVKIMRDMTEQRLNQEKAAFMANHDMLTLLPNRAYFSDRLHEAIVHAQREGNGLALLLLDLDRFKSINDTLGHHVGDLLLKEVAQRLQLCVRETDTVARLGGDEFVVIQTNVVETEDAAMLAQKLVDTLEQPYLLEGQEVHSGTSIGVTVCPLDATDAAELLKNADLALYRAKDRGRHNYQFYTEEMHATILSRQQMEQDLRGALVNQEFSLYYQPQIDLETWRICGVEALLRWRNPHLQTLTPGDFLDLAQESGLIVPIGEWVLREACRQNKAWQEAGIPAFRIGVNFCARQVNDPRFIQMIKRVLAETGLRPEFLEMEITESQFVKDREAIQAILGELMAMGIRISTDDFGTALSSLNLLCQFPMDTLKIDRTVIEHVAHRKQDRAMAAAVIKLANDLNVRVVAEGVETMEQLTFLQDKGCQAAQGFLFSPPVSARSLEVLLRAGSWSRMNSREDAGQ